MVGIDTVRNEHKDFSFWKRALMGMTDQLTLTSQVWGWKDQKMTTLCIRIRLIAAGVVLLAAGTLPAGVTAGANEQEPGVVVTPVRVEKLANLPGKTLSVVTVHYAPGAASSRHHHAGSVFAYVLSGAVRSENSATGPVRVYKTGESFVEPPGSEHLVSENASATEPASLLVVFVADDGARLTTFDK
jgi:quercetin dioxygenase-like cupin family protein